MNPNPVVTCELVIVPAYVPVILVAVPEILCVYVAAVLASAPYTNPVVAIIVLLVVSAGVTANGTPINCGDIFGAATEYKLSIANCIVLAVLDIPELIV